MSNDEKLIFEANGASPLEIARLNEMTEQRFAMKWCDIGYAKGYKKARAEVIEEVRKELFKEFKVGYWTVAEARMAFDNILTKLSKGK